MGLLSSVVSITRYSVEGRLKGPVLETVASGLRRYAIAEAENESAEKIVGWTSFERPYDPNFEGSSFVVGSYFVFSLRIDRKSVPAGVVKKHIAQETAKRLAESGRSYLSRDEKEMIAERVKNVLALRIPATPNVHDLVWSYEDGQLWFFSNQKSANEELETLFLKSFDLLLIRLFPFTMADLAGNLSDIQRDALLGLSPTTFVR